MQDDTRTHHTAAPPIDIDHVIAQLAGHQAYLAAHIDRHWDDLEPLQLARTLSLYGQNAARLGRLFHDRPAILGEDRDAGDHAGSAQASPDIDDVITALAASQDRLSAYLDSHRDELEPRPLERLLSVYSQNATRLGRLLRYRTDIYGPPPDPFRVAMDEGLDLFWEEVNARNAANAANAANAYNPPPFDPPTT